MITIYKVMTQIINNLNFNYSNLLSRLINYNNNFNKAHSNLKKNWPKNQFRDIPISVFHLQNATAYIIQKILS